ncbi:MAG: hypothetical protein FJ161_00210 [Gammaproteobacteria bacterium]|nr:hypothetical protein [Gammaproteobacteria bacterium]
MKIAHLNNLNQIAGGDVVNPQEPPYFTGLSKYGASIYEKMYRIRDLGTGRTIDYTRNIAFIDGQSQYDETGIASRKHNQYMQGLVVGAGIGLLTTLGFLKLSCL